MGVLKSAVIGFAIVLACAAWVMVLVVTDVDQDQQLNRAEARAGSTAMAFEEQVYRQILSVDQSLRVLKMDRERNPALFDHTALQRLTSLLSDVVSAITVVDARGHVTASTQRDLADADISGRRFFQVHRNDASPAPLITGPFQVNGAWSLSISRRVETEHGVFGGAVMATYDLNALTRSMAQADLGPRSMIMLAGRDGAVWAIFLQGMQEPGGDIRGSPLYRAMFESGEQVWIGPSGPDRGVRINAWRQIPGQQLILVVGLDRNAALGNAETRRQQAFLSAAGITLLILMMAGGVNGMIASAQGRERRLSEDRAVLAAANLRLAEARWQAHEKTLQLSMTLAGMSDGVSMFDAERRLVQWNDRYADLNGLPREALRVGMPLAELLRLQAQAGEFGSVDVEAEVALRLPAARDLAEPPVAVQRRANGAVIEMRRTRLPDGGLVTLYADITGRKQAEDAQIRAREQAEIAAQEKSRFVAIVSHEIRTPLNVALNSLSLLDRSSLSPAQRQLVGTGLLAGEALMSLLNDILDLSRMQAGRMQLRPAPFALRPLLDGVVDMFRHQAEERGVAFSVAVMPGVPQRLVTDSSRLRQALMNLVNNAAKFAEPGPASIRVCFATLDGDAVLRFAVRDCGPDIPDLDRARLFRPFSQLQHPGSAGTGLGLAICQLLANLLGGQIGCDTVAGGKEFWLTLPTDVAHAPPDLPVPLAQAPPSWLPRTRILLVEDIPANQLIVATALRREGHMVDLASSGLEALELIAASPYDIVLLDIFMPGIDGLETARRIRAMPKGCGRVPIVALTANVSAEDKATYLAAGMEDLVAKPVQTGLLLAALSRLVWHRGSPVPDRLRTDAPPVHSDVVDMGRIRDWRRGLPPKVADALFTDCLQQLRVMVPALQAALACGNPQAIGQAAHAIAGVAANYGLTGLEAAVRALAVQPEALEAERQAAALPHEVDRAERAVAESLHAEAV